jgi:hypothetical protein
MTLEMALDAMHSKNFFRETLVPPVKLFPTRILGGFLQNSTGEYAVAPDGRLLIITVTANDGAQGQIEIVENWFEELKPLVPVN